jgi:ribonuclease HII
LTKSERCAQVYAYDAALWASGLFFAGIDEAGRGPLAGCVMASCVIMPKQPVLRYVYDSKQLSEKQRSEVFAHINEHAVYIGLGRAEVEEIEQMNILEATKLAMRRAADLAPVSLFLVDAVTRVGLKGQERPMISGDAVSYSIAAASIVAKVTRDREMFVLDMQYPQYGFAGHKGYGTKAHIEAIKKYGPSPIHRTSFLSRILVS